VAYVISGNGYAMLHVAKIVSGCQKGSFARAGNVAYSIKISLNNIISVWGYVETVYMCIFHLLSCTTQEFYTCLSN